MAKETTQQKTRSKTDIILEQHTWDIWGYVRNNKMSLDSERACKMIRKGFDDAVAEVRAMLDDVSSQNDRLREELKELKKKRTAKAEPVTVDAA